MLKLVALSPDCRALKEKAREVLEHATTEAGKQVDAISVYDFDHIVFRASRAEGMWEPDMLFRLFGIFHRTEARTKAYSTGELEIIAQRVRGVSHIPTWSALAPPLSSWRIQQKELYDPAEYINGLHLPIEVGDVFRKTDGAGTKHFIVLGQPCDLMVRSDGKRYPDEGHAVLAEIAETQDPPKHAVELPYFGEQPNQRYFVRLRRVQPIRLCILDLCVYNADGRAALDLNGTCPEGLTPAWKTRFDKSKKLCEKLVRRYETVYEVAADSEEIRRLKADIRGKLASELSINSLFKGAIDLEEGNRKIAFNCQRVKRLCPARAAAMMREYAICLSRPAFEPDLGTPIAEDAA